MQVESSIQVCLGNAPKEPFYSRLSGLLLPWSTSIIKSNCVFLSGLIVIMLYWIREMVMAQSTWPYSIEILSMWHYDIDHVMLEC